MASASVSANGITIPGMVSVKATEASLPPGWALMERHLIRIMAEAADLFVDKYTRPGGGVYYVQDVDDIYEIFHNWGLFYVIGADERVLDKALQAWNATTRHYDDGVASKNSGPVHPFFMAQLHNEYWNLAIPYNSDWFHMGEGNQAFYDFGLADPTNSENMRRARRFAEMYMGDDPKAPNYDPEYRVIRSPFHGSEGPLLHAHSKARLIHSTGKTTEDIDFVKAWLEPGAYGGFFHRSIVRDWERWADSGRRPTGTDRLSILHPVVKDLEPNWFDSPGRREEIVGLFDKMALNGDVPENLGATGLVTNAYLYTGEAKYKRWVLEYVDAWMDRTRRNNGVMPDNVGPTGKIGEHREGQWWGGIHGWNSEGGGANRLLISIAIAAECAHLLSGDSGYLDLLRSQIKLLLSHSITREDGQLLIPTRHGPSGWAEYQPMKVYELAHLYHASMAPEDYELFAMLREGERESDWNRVDSERDRRSGNSEYARFQYYDGQNPDWPEAILRAEYQHVVAMVEAMRSDPRDVDTIIRDNRWPPCHAEYPSRRDYGCEAANPLVMKGLTQVTMGTPQNIYNGGLCRARVRYFDQDRARPGLPEDVAALVDNLEPDRMGIQLVNTSTSATRSLIVQAGAFAEHQFTEIRVQEGEREASKLDPGAWLREKRRLTQRVVPVDAKHFAVELPPSGNIRLDIGMRRFVNRPSYAFPWHGDKIPFR